MKSPVETLKTDRPILSDLSDDTVLNAIENFLHHASVLKTRKWETLLIDCFSFKLVTIENIFKKILSLDAAKATQSDDVPSKIIKNFSDIFLIFFKQTVITLLKQVLLQSN